MADKQLAIPGLALPALAPAPPKPKLGEVKLGAELGYKSRGQKYIWSSCNICGKERWVALVKGQPIHKFCYPCAIKPVIAKLVAQNSLKWKDTRLYTREGYVLVTIYPDNPYYQMGMKKHKTGVTRRILEHRLIVAQELGRPLLPSEKVHHRNGIKDDNRPANLKLVSPLDHNIYTELCKQCPVRKEVRLLRWQVRQLNAQIQGRLLPEGDKDHG